jgi:SAM-dependent methyltransferase
LSYPFSSPAFESITVGYFPLSAQELLLRAIKFAAVLTRAKESPLEPGVDWYPYHTMAALRFLVPIFRVHFPELARAAASGPMLDIGCGDGDLALFLAALGCRVTAIDNPPTNYNLMKGVRALSGRLNLPVEIIEMNVDSQFTLHGGPYGFALMLGILYHLKNPFYVLETMARHVRYCAISTRVATETMAKTKIGEEPLAYLLDHREANDDGSNFWIFSPAGLRRLAKRTGWRVIGATLAGCTKRSNPVDPDRDARMFMFLESQRLSTPAEVTLLDGWTAVGEHNWAWTLKKFSLEARVQDQSRLARFSLGFITTREMVDAAPVNMRCTANGAPIEEQSFNKPGEQVFEALIPATIGDATTLRFEFTVTHRYKPGTDLRDLGVIVPFNGEILGISQKLPFWLG